jgi:hypothetical protein
VIKNLNILRGLERLETRLKTPLDFYPFPVLIAVGMITLTMCYTFSVLNPRLESRAQVVKHKATGTRESSLWMSIYPENNQVYVRLSGQTFALPSGGQGRNQLAEFIKFLKHKVHEQTVIAGLSLEIPVYRTEAILAVDETLQYHHIEPVIYALAEAKIRSYGFETRPF